ncbi:MAG: cell division protein FtsQ/DivIB [Zoogloeaceae bacterium]|jgi:cell division protein FtsQ|nr:cell division protein FtsQ/DivIB [Zoogloeaceae bacterium]
MWHQPKLLNALADMLFVAGGAMLLALLAILFLRMPLASVRIVQLSAPLRHVAPMELEEALAGRLRGNFFSLSVEGVREALERLPWVRRASVRRVWPDQLAIDLEEQRPAARWGDSGSEWVNVYGEVFAATWLAAEENGNFALPRLKGPPGTAAQLLQRYGESSEMLAGISLRPVAVTLSARQALEMDLTNNMKLKLGREQNRSSANERLRRFIEMYPTVVANRIPPPRVVDLRYPNGFAVYPGRLRNPADGR